MEMYTLYIDIHNDSYTYSKKSEIDLAFKKLENNEPGVLRIYDAVTHEISFEKEYSSERYFRRFKDANWLAIDEVNEIVSGALEDRQSLLNGDFD